MDLYFSDLFGVSEETIEDYGAFNISLVTDLPLFEESGSDPDISQTNKHGIIAVK